MMKRRELWTLYVKILSDSPPNPIKIFDNKKINELIDSAIEQGILLCDPDDIQKLMEHCWTVREIHYPYKVCDQLSNNDIIRITIRSDNNNSRRSSLGLDSLHFDCGDHVCWMVDNDELEIEIVGKFIIEGVHLNHKVIIVAPSKKDIERLKPTLTKRKIKDLLKARQFDTEQYVKSGQLSFVYADAIGLSETFSPDDVYVSFKKTAQQAIAEGYSALRATGDRCWTMHTFDAQGNPAISKEMLNKVVNYEIRFNKLVEECPYIIGLCRYDRRRFSEKTLEKILTIHPQAAVNNELFDNFYYIPPTKLDKGLPFSHRVSNLEERKLIDIEMKETIKEITRAKQRLERELEGKCKANHDAELLYLMQKQRSQFIAQMSHEIRSPLNGIIASVSLLSHSSLAAEHQEMVQAIEESTQELLLILSKVLDPTNPLSLSCFTNPSPLTLPVEPPKSPIALSESFAKRPYFSPSLRSPYILSTSLSPSLSSPALSSPYLSSPSRSPKFSNPLNLSSDGDSTPPMFATKNPLTHSTSPPSLKSKVMPTTAFTEVSNKFPRLLHILVVDDNEINRRVLERMISRFEKVVWTSVTNGEEAVQACGVKMYDVILMDLYMPVLNGIDASREILNISRTRRRKPLIVAVTASVTDEIKRECIEDVGMAGFISKPINVNVFLQIFTSILPKLKE